MHADAGRFEPLPATDTRVDGARIADGLGEFDEYRWHDEMKKEVEFLRSRGTVARYSVEKGQPHRIETLAGPNAGRLFDGFEETKKGCSK